MSKSSVHGILKSPQLLSKTILFIQLGLFILGIILSIINKSVMPSFNVADVGGFIIVIIYFVAFIIILILAIFQIILGATTKHTWSLVAGILGVLSFIWPIAIAAIVINILIAFFKF